MLSSAEAVKQLWATHGIFLCFQLIDNMTKALDSSKIYVNGYWNGGRQ